MRAISNSIFDFILIVLKSRGKAYDISQNMTVNKMTAISHILTWVFLNVLSEGNKYWKIAKSIFKNI